MSNKFLIILFAILLGLFALSKIMGGKKDRSFEKEIAVIDASKVDEIIFHPKSDLDQGYSLVKNKDNWKVSNNTVTANALSERVSSLLSNLNLLQAKRIVSKSEEKWPEYEVNIDKGKRIEIKGGNKTIEDLIIGRLKFNQQTRTAVTYIRKNNQNNVYAVDGFLSMQLNQDMNSFRNKILVELNKDSIASIELTDEKGSRLLTKQNYWLNANNELVDSTEMQHYLLGVLSLSGIDFDDVFDPANSQVSKSLLVKSLDGSQLEIKCYNAADQLKPFVIWSSFNPDAFFRSDSTGTFDKVFGDHSIFN